MSFLRTKFFRVSLGPVLLISCLVISQASYRATASVIFLGLVACYIHFLITSKTKWLRLVFVAFVISAFIPIDVSLQNFAGPPRFVPLIMGSPRDDDIAREGRGEVMLGGCILRGNPPKWVWVW